MAQGSGRGLQAHKPQGQLILHSALQSSITQGVSASAIEQSYARPSCYTNLSAYRRTFTARLLAVPFRSVVYQHHKTAHVYAQRFYI